MTRQLYECTCSGGPLDGQTFSIRYPEGILAVDKENGEAAIYRRNGAVCEFDRLEATDDDKRWKTIEEDRFEVISYG